MTDQQPTIKDLDALRRRSRRLRLIAVAVSCTLIAGIWLMAKRLSDVHERQDHDESARLEAYNRQIAIEQAEHYRLDRIEQQRRQQVADSITRANMPSYSIADVHEMVRTVAPDYSWVYLWRMDNDNWIMQYMKEYGDKEHWFIQRFNPSTRKFEKAIEFSTIHYKNLTDDKGIYTKPANLRCSFTEDNILGTLDYYEDGKHIGTFTRNGIEHDCRLASNNQGPLTKKRICALESAPPDWMDDGYESAEDYYYDNEEDLYFYYNP
ncbi:MAG: hypothetical protein NC111_03950 [Bacteroides sp.]|nr:hypothetical protein [Bacteroides sp.]MCM1412956.1 hypothetical protein [Bacteroides sp.]MCM1471662.1 hypothetical protein [Bacteroides sp.]